MHKIIDMYYSPDSITIKLNPSNETLEIDTDWLDSYFANKIVDDLTSTSSTAPLSANQGRVLAQQIYNVAMNSGGIPIFTHIFLDYLLPSTITDWVLSGSTLNASDYPVVYQHILDDYNSGTTVNDVVTISNINNVTVTQTIPCVISSDLHKIVDISNKSLADTLCTTTGVAWYYVLDTVNQQVILPRNDHFISGNESTSTGVVYQKDQIVNLTGFPLSINVNGSGGFNSVTNGILYSKTSAGSPTTYSATAVTYRVGINTSLQRNTGSWVSPRACCQFVYFKVA